jgi:hypothetical protein
MENGALAIERGERRNRLAVVAEARERVVFEDGNPILARELEEPFPALGRHRDPGRIVEGGRDADQLGAKRERVSSRTTRRRPPSSKGTGRS